MIWLDYSTRMTGIVQRPNPCRFAFEMHKNLDANIFRFNLSEDKRNGHLLPGFWLQLHARAISWILSSVACAGCCSVAHRCESGGVAGSRARAMLRLLHSCLNYVPATRKTNGVCHTQYLKMHTCRARLTGSRRPAPAVLFSMYASPHIFHIYLYIVYSFGGCYAWVHSDCDQRNPLQIQQTHAIAWFYAPYTKSDFERTRRMNAKNKK